MHFLVSRLFLSQIYESASYYYDIVYYECVPGGTTLTVDIGPGSSVVELHLIWNADWDLRLGSCMDLCMVYLPRIYLCIKEEGFLLKTLWPIVWHFLRYTTSQSVDYKQTASRTNNQMNEYCVIEKEEYWKRMAGQGIEPGTPVTLVRSSTPELPRPIPTIHIAPTTTIE